METNLIDVFTEGAIAAVTGWARPTLPGALTVRAALHSSEAGVRQAPVCHHNNSITQRERHTQTDRQRQRQRDMKAKEST